MKLKKRSIFGILLSFALMLTVMPALGLSQTAYAEDPEWRSDIDVSEDTQYRGSFTVTKDITIRIAAGKTMFVDGVIYAPGKTVTVKGPGTLIVNAWTDNTAFTGVIKVKGANVELNGGEGSDGDFANDGGSGIRGNAIVDDGSLIVTGGNGGDGADAGSGGLGISGNAQDGTGNLTVNGGSVHVSGGNGGSGLSSGSPGKAVFGNLSGTSFWESDDDETYSKVSGPKSTKQYLRAEGPDTISVKLDVGAGHADQFGSEMLTFLENEVDACDATISGNVITFTGVKASMTEDELRNILSDALTEKGFRGGKYNNERWVSIGYKAFDEYPTYKALNDDVENEAHEATRIKDDFKLFMLWAKMCTNLEMDNGNPICGKEATSAKPTPPKGTVYYNNPDDPESLGFDWTDDEYGKVETFQGGNEYCCFVAIRIDPEGDLWKTFFDEDTKVNVKGGTNVTVYATSLEMLTVAFKAKADHDWDEGTVTKQPTTTEDGEKLYTCKTPDCGATKTEAIPKLKPAASGTFIAKLATKGKNSLNISWNKVQGADGYDIFFAPCNKNGKQFVCKNVKSMNGNNAVSWTNSGLKKGTAYKAYVKAYVMENGQKKYINTSPQVHAYAGGYTKKFTNAKSVTVKKAKVSLKKGKTYKIKAKVKKLKKSKKLMPKSHVAKLRYMTSDAKVATVSKSGKITAKGKGKCVVTVYAHNGVSKNVKVTVK